MVLQVLELETGLKRDPPTIFCTQNGSNNIRDLFFFLILRVFMQIPLKILCGKSALNIQGIWDGSKMENM